MGALYKDLSERPAEEVKLKLKHGSWEVEISCAESRVKQVVENVLSSDQVRRRTEGKGWYDVSRPAGQPLAGELFFFRKGARRSP
jgi:hypothetical protein